MKTKIYPISVTLIFLVLFFTSCKSVSKLYNNGDYDQAVYVAIKKMEKNKLSTQNKEIVADAYAKAILQYEAEILNLEQSNDLYKWEAILYKYQKAQQLSYAINRSSNALQYVVPKNYFSSITTAINNAVDVRKQRALYLLDQNNKIAAQGAYNELSIALNLLPHHLELNELRNEAYNKAVTNILIYPIQARFFSNDFDINNLENTIIANLRNSNQDIFVKYFTPYQIRMNNNRVDYTVEMNYEGIKAERSNHHSSEINVQKENVLIREIRIRPDSIVKEYGTVYAKYTAHNITQIYRGGIFLQVKDMQTNQSIVNRTVEAVYCFVNNYASYTGDVRALTQEQKTNIEQGQKVISKNEVVNHIADELSRKIVREMNL